MFRKILVLFIYILGIISPLKRSCLYMYVEHEHVQCLICFEIIIKNVFEFENVFYILILNLIPSIRVIL